MVAGTYRFVFGVVVLLLSLLSTGCVSIHDDVFRSRIPGESGSLYTVLKQRLQGATAPSTPADAAKSITALLPDSAVARVLDDTLVAYSPLGLALKNAPAGAACLGAEATRNLQATVDKVIQDAKSAKLRLGQIHDFLKEIHDLRRAGGGTPTLLMLPLQLPAPAGPDSVSLLHFLGGYLTAYSNGTFVDRNGTGLSKPSIDAETSRVGNDTITAFVSVIIEAITDHFFYRHRACVEYPIVLGKQADGTPAWLTVGGGMPTLARVLGLDDKTTPDKIPAALNGIAEAAKEDDGPGGIGPKKLKLIRLAGGVAGDEGKLISGLVIRNFGGMHFGQFVFGKISVGDNETLSRIAETIFGRVAKRTNESVASHVLYNQTILQDLDWMLDAVAKLKDDSAGPR
jgi:hypothetical protein